MANIANWLELRILDLVMDDADEHGSEWLPETVYAGIMNDDATEQQLEEGTLTNEITAYTGNRKAITWGDIALEGSGADAKATVSNAAAIEFEDMPAPGGKEVQYVIICDAPTSGNILWWLPIVDGETPTTKTWNEGDTFRIPIGDLTISID